MPDNRGSRFALEVLFLLALAVALTLADLKAFEIVGIMLLGWLIVAALEWVAWREEPHYGSGLPPRYYVPQVSLPPAQPLEQNPARYPDAGYPESRDEAPTWIASAALREEMLGVWPVAAPPDFNGAEPEQETAPEPVVDHEPVETDPWTREQELPAAPLDELEHEPQLAHEPQLEPQAQPVAVAAVQPEAVEEEDVPPDALEQREAVESPDSDTVPHAPPEHSVQGVARYNLDPLAEPKPRRRFGRGGAPELLGAVDVPARPAGLRALPGRTNREDGS